MTFPPVVFVWENFGPMHMDRCNAVAKYFAGRRSVIGIELAGRSATYDWETSTTAEFEKITLFPDVSAGAIPPVRLFFALMKACLKLKRTDLFFCHYEKPEILLATILLRMLRYRVFTMNDSKFDDKTRHLSRELVKPLFLRPYCGAIVAGRRAGEYLEFLHFPRTRIAFGYDTISVERIRRDACAIPAPAGACFESRHFTTVARMIEKKNLFLLLEAFATYAKGAQSPRPLYFYGSGPLGGALRSRAAALGIDELVVFQGSASSSEVSRGLAKSLALLLVSTEEQFGLVIPEALAMGVPVIVSKNCGARDELVRTGVNGFLVEPDNARGIAYFMGLIGTDEGLWRRLAEEALAKAPLGDVARFVQSVNELALLAARGS